MLVSFTGAQCTGKTTLLKRCKTELSAPKVNHPEPKGPWHYVDEVTRKVMRGGLPINESGGNLTQLFILKEHLENHTRCGENLILDRCILDGYVYTKWLVAQGSVERWVLDYATRLLSILGERLDVILYTEPDDIQIEDDGERSINDKFRNDIINIYEDLLSCSISTPGRDTWRQKVVRLSGSVEDRMETIKSNLKQ